MELGSHAFFILAAYAATALIVAALVLRAAIDHRTQVRALAELERRGARRRSAAWTSSDEAVAASSAIGRSRGVNP